MDIRYKLQARSRGRNGFFTTSGVSVDKSSLLGEKVIDITTFTGKDQRSDSILLRIPKDKAAEIGQALIDLSKEP